MNKEIKPIIDEVYWILFQNYYKPPYHFYFGLHDIFHFNSLTCTRFLDQRSPYEQLKKNFVYISEKIITNFNSDIFLRNKDKLIKKELPFVKIIDDCKWIVDVNIIKKYENNKK